MQMSSCMDLKGEITVKEFNDTAPLFLSLNLFKW